MHDLVKMPNFILVSKVTLTGTDVNTTKTDTKLGDDSAAGDITLKLDFAVPWEVGKAGASTPSTGATLPPAAPGTPGAAGSAAVPSAAGVGTPAPSAPAKPAT